MKKAWFRLIAFALIVVVALSGCSGGSNNNTTEQAGNPGNNQPNSKNETSSDSIIELTAWSTNEPPSGIQTSKASDTKIGAAIAEATGVSFTTNFTQGDPEQAFNLRLASNDWEDVIATNTINFDWTDKLIQADAIIPLDKYFNDPENYPNLAKIPASVLDNYRFSDGHIYQFPSQWYEDPNSIYGYWAAMGWYAHPDLLEAVNMTADDLATLDGVHRFLKAVKDAGLKNADGLPIIPMSSGSNLSLWTTIATTFGVSTAGMGFAQQADGSFLHFRDDPRLVDALKWLNGLNREGLLDQELVSQQNEKLQEKLTNRRVALMADVAWPFWGTVTAGESPVTELQYLHFPKADGVEKLGTSSLYNPNGTSGVFVTKQSKNPDAIARYADWGSTQGQSRGWEITFGPRGEFWDWDPEEGEPYFALTDPEIKDAYENGDYKKMNELGSSILVNITPFDLDLNYYRKASEKQLFWIFDMHRWNVQEGYISKSRPFDTLKMPADGLWNKNIAILAALDLEFFAKLITAKSDEEFEGFWDDYVRQLESQGDWSKVKEEWLQTYNEQVG